MELLLDHAADVSVVYLSLSLALCFVISGRMKLSCTQVVPVGFIGVGFDGVEEVGFTVSWRRLYGYNRFIGVGLHSVISVTALWELL